MSSTQAMLDALREYDEAMAAQKKARERVRDAETKLKRVIGARYDTYMDGNEMVAALGRQLVVALRGDVVPMEGKDGRDA
jgi:hypothetical protein